MLLVLMGILSWFCHKALVNSTLRFHFTAVSFSCGSALKTTKDHGWSQLNLNKACRHATTGCSILLSLSSHHNFPTPSAGAFCSCIKFWYTHCSMGCKHSVSRNTEHRAQSNNDNKENARKSKQYPHTWGIWQWYTGNNFKRVSWDRTALCQSRS